MLILLLLVLRMRHMTKLTLWLARSVKPVRIGVYELCFDEPDQYLHFSHFDGARWNGAWSDVERADEEKHWHAEHSDQGYAEHMTGWRGLARAPK